MKDMITNKDFATLWAYMISATLSKWIYSLWPECIRNVSSMLSVVFLRGL